VRRGREQRPLNHTIKQRLMKVPSWRFREALDKKHLQSLRDSMHSGSKSQLPKKVSTGREKISLNTVGNFSGGWQQHPLSAKREKQGETLKHGKSYLSFGLQ